MSSQSIPRGDLGVRPLSEEKILRMRKGLVEGEPRKTPKGSNRVFASAQTDGTPLLSAAAVELATARCNALRLGFLIGGCVFAFNMVCARDRGGLSLSGSAPSRALG